MGATKKIWLSKTEKAYLYCEWCGQKKRGECLKCLEPICLECDGGPFCEPCQEHIDKE